MSKQTREEKRAEERRIIAEMEAAMQEKEDAEKGQAEQGEKGEETPQTSENAPSENSKKEEKSAQEKKKRFHCPRCKTLLGDDGLCPTCGYKMYIPMDEKKRNKIKLIITVVAMAVFVVLFVLLQFKK